MIHCWLLTDHEKCQNSGQEKVQYKAISGSIIARVLINQKGNNDQH